MLHFLQNATKIRPKSVQKGHECINEFFQEIHMGKAQYKQSEGISQKRVNEINTKHEQIMIIWSFKRQI